MSSERYAIKDANAKMRAREDMFRAFWMQVYQQPGRKLVITPLEQAHLPAGMMIVMTRCPQSGALTFEASCGDDD